MITDPPPKSAARQREYARSDAIVTMPLPPAETIRVQAVELAAAMAGGEIAPVRRAGTALLATLAAFYRVPVPTLRVLGVRPHRVTQGVCTYQLFGDYTPSTQRIRVWMRTAIRREVSSPKALLNTLLHEFCHHLDATRLECPQSFHTRGFFVRIDHLYHHVLATEPSRRRPLSWIRRGAVWAIDWRKLNPSRSRRA